MSEILQDLSAPTLVQAIEANLFEWFLLYRRWPRAEVHRDADVLWVISDVPFPLFNSVMRAQLAPDNVDAAIEAVVARYRSRQMPILWWTGPATQPADLGAHLLVHGFDHEEWPGMAVDLQALNENLPESTDLVVEQVRDNDTLKEWCRVVAGLGFEFPDFAVEAMFDLFQSVGLGADRPIRHYTGRLNGEVVAGSSLALGAGVAGIYNVATVPTARRRGFATAMVLAPLREARALGYRAATLYSSEMAQGVYRRLGFQEYCKIGLYAWQPTSARDGTA